MKTELTEISSTLKALLNQQTPSPLKIRKDNEATFEVAGTIEAMQGKQKVDGYYFASVITKPKDIRFYFFPIYTHPDQFKLSDELQKCLKGKSCFHIKRLTIEMEKEINSIVVNAIKLYKKDNLI